MTKVELINTWAQKHGMSQRAGKEAADDLLGMLFREVMNTQSTMTFKGLGSFKCHDSKKRKARNPQTGEELTVAPKRTVKLRLADALVRHPK